MNIELAIEKEIHLMQTNPRHRLENVPGIFESVDVTDLGTVIRRYRKLGDSQVLQHQLNDDFGVEVEIVGVSLKRNLGQRCGGIEAVTGMKFREIRLEDAILEASQDLVADSFVERH